MIRISEKKGLFKLSIKIMFFGVLAALFIYGLLNAERPDKSTIIDKTITYTSTEINTFSIPLNVTPSAEEVVASIPKYVTVPEGGLDWKLFSQTKSVPYQFKDEEGQELHGVQPEFSNTLRKLDGQIIKMQGYMFPLNAAEDQSMFLFGPFPVSCPFHYHVGPALVIEAYAAEKIEFGFEPIVLEGTLELVPRDDDYNVFYRLKEVRLIK